MTDPLRVAVIGVGAMGRNHARVYSEMPGVQLVGVADTDGERMQSVADEFNTLAWTGYRAMLKVLQPQAVSICVPTGSHMTVSLDCIHAGCHVLVEKPVAGTCIYADLMVRNAERVCTVFQVGHIERFNPAVVELKRQIDAGELGTIYAIDCRRSGPFSPRQRDVGVVHDLMVHDLDLVRWLTGQEPEVLSAQVRRGIKTQHEDMAVATLRAGDTLCTLEADWLSGRKERRLVVTAERGTWEADLVNRRLRMWYDVGGVNGHPLHFERACVVNNCEPLRAELDAFVATCRGEAPVAVTGEDGLRALELVEAVVRAAEGERCTC